ncbi:MAG: cation:proton antiporter [Candidatus Diapherotrites archaeon]
MIDVGFIIGLIGLIIFFGFFASVFFQRTKIPDVLLLIFIGMLIGPILGYISSASLMAFAPLIGTIALIIIVFEGGAKLDLETVIKQLPQASIFTVIVCILTAIISMVFTIFLGMPLIYGLLLGFIIAGTSYEIIASLVSKLSVSEEIKTLLSLESAFNTAITIVAAIALVQLISLKTFDVINPFQKIASAFSIAIVLGIIAAFLWAKIMKILKGQPYHYLLSLSSSFVLYVVTEILGGNGITSILIFGLVLANYNTITRALNLRSYFKIDYSVKTLQTEVSFFVRTMFFVYLGAVFNFSEFTQQIIITSLVVFLAIIIARYASIKILLKLNNSLKESDTVIMSMLPRGLGTAVLASLPLSFGLKLDFTNIVLMIVILSNVFATITVFYFERAYKKNLIATTQL